MKNTMSLFFGVVALFFLLTAGCGREEDVASNESLLSGSEVVAENAQNDESVQSDKAGSAGSLWQYGDVSSRIVWEARYALSKSANGSSTFPTANNRYGAQWYGDWNYIASDLTAYNKAAAEAFGVVGGIDDDLLNKPPRHRGGWCTFFVRLVLFRSTYWMGNGFHLTTPNYPSSVYSWVGDVNHMTQNYSIVQPGWIFSSKDIHMAVADKRELLNGLWGWWFIDANYLGGDGNYFIGKHFMPDTVLKSQGYWAWKADWATTN